MRQDIHDVRDIKMERIGKITTVWVDGDITYQASDTTLFGQTEAGWAVISSRGPVGLKIYRFSLSPSVSSPPTWDGPQNASDFIFYLVENAGYKVLSHDGNVRAFVEGASTGDGRFSEWINDGVREWVQYAYLASRGGTSVRLNGGQLNVPGVNYKARNTLEAWVRVHENQGPLFYLMVSAQELNEDWWRLRGGLFLKEGSSEDLAGLSWRFGMETAIEADDVFAIGHWHHVAVVRNLDTYTVYVDFEQVGSGKNTLGNYDLPGMLLTVGNNADHDMVTSFTETGLMDIDALALTSRVLIPSSFMLLSGKADPPITEDNRYIQVKDVVAEATRAVSVPVVIACDKDVAGVSFTLEFDESLLEILSVSNNSAAASMTQVGTDIEAANSSGKLAITLVDSSNSNPIPFGWEEGLLIVKFMVSRDADGTLDLGLNDVSASTPDGEVLDLIAVGGRMKVNRGYVRPPTGDNLIWITDSEGEIGDTVSMNVMLNVEKDIASTNFTVNFDNSSLQIESVSNGEASSAMIQLGMNLNDANESGALVISLVDFSFGNPIPAGENREIFKVNFIILEAADDTLELKLTDLSFTDTDAGKLYAAKENGTITVEKEDIVPGAGESYLWIADVNAVPGSEIVVPVYLNSEIDVAGISFEVGFNNENLKLVSVTNGSSASELTQLGTDISQANSNGELSVSLVDFTFDNAVPEGRDREVLLLSFAISPDAEGQETLSLTDAKLSDPGAEDIISEVRGGTIYIGENKPVIRYSFEPMSGHPPLTVTFDASKCYSPQADEQLEYIWIIDGQEELVGVTHTYTLSENGRYSVVLEVTNESGLTSRENFIVVVYENKSYESGDVSRDGKTDISDILDILSILSIGQDDRADTNGDGKVDVFDLLNLLNGLSE